MFAYLFLRNSTDPSLRTDPSLSTDPSLDSTQIRLYLWETLQYLNIHRRHRFIQIKHMYITWLKKIQGTPNQVLLQRIIFKFEADCWWEKHTVYWLSNITSNDENSEICSVAWSDILLTLSMACYYLLLKFLAVASSRYPLSLSECISFEPKAVL